MKNGVFIVLLGLWLTPPISLAQTDTSGIGQGEDPVDVEAALNGATFLVIAIGAAVQHGANNPQFFDYLGVRTLVDAATAEGLRHVVLLSSAGAGPHTDQTRVPASVICAIGRPKRKITSRPAACPSPSLGQAVSAPGPEVSGVSASGNRVRIGRAW